MPHVGVESRFFHICLKHCGNTVLKLVVYFVKRIKCIFSDTPVAALQHAHIINIRQFNIISVLIPDRPKLQIDIGEQRINIIRRSRHLLRFGKKRLLFRRKRMFLCV